MAREKTRQQEAPAARVHKANEVHKRRVERPAPTRKAKLDLPDPSTSVSGVDAVPRRRPVITAADIPAIDDSPMSHASDSTDGAASDKRNTVDEQAEQVAAREVEGSDDAGEPHEGFYEKDGASETGALDKESKSADGAAGAASDSAESESANDSTADAEPPRNRTSFRKVALALFVIAVLGIVAAVSWIAWDRWGRYDDHADMQGDWYVRGTMVVVPIDEHTIKLADDVVYNYAIDDHDKTISYTFGDWKGSGRYWFSDDRSKLVITDGDTFTGTSNTVDDLVRKFDELTAVGNGQPVTLPEGDGIIVLTRTANLDVIIAEEIKKRAAEEAAAKLAAEEAAEDEGYYDEYGDYYEYEE